MKTMISFVAILAILLVSACSNTQPVPPYQSGDGGRGMNPGSRAESTNGAGVQRNM